MDGALDGDAPATTRLGPPGGPDRRLRLAIAAVTVGLVLAVLKPWDLVAPAPPDPGDVPSTSASAGPGPVEPATPGPTPWTGIGNHLACFSGEAWTVVLDELDRGRIARSWTRVEPGPATGPGDPGIVRLHAYADAVPRMGFCPPGPRAAGPPRAPEVDLWLLQPGAAGPAGFATVAGRVVTAGSAADGGVLLAPAAPATRRATRRSARASWPPGTYVFRVGVPGTARDAAGATWFAVELRGPWPGVDATPPSTRPPAAPGPDPVTPPVTPGPDASSPPPG